MAPPWWWLLAPHAARRLATRPSPATAALGTQGRRPQRPRRATLLLTSMLVVAALLGPLVAAGPVGSVAAGALPPADDGPLGATGALPDFFTPPGDLPDASGPGGTNPAGVDAGAGVAGIPAGMLVAYRRAETNLAGSAPSCRLGWALVAAIGKVESSHARGGALDATGTTLSPILGPRLDGSGANAAIPDTDGGAYDGDTVWDRAVGPTQFIPSTWQAYGVDANNDGRADPNNAHDAATATGRYLCAGDLDLADPRQLHDAVFRYNHSESYVNTVLSWARIYASGATATPDATRTPNADTGTGRGARTGRDPLTLAAASAALPANVPLPAVSGPTAAPATATSAVPPAAGPASPATGGQPPTPTTPAPTTSAPTTLAPRTSTPRSTTNPAPTSTVPGTPASPRPGPGSPAPGSPAPGSPTVTTPPRPTTPGGPGAPATTSTVPSTKPTSAEQACRALTPGQVAEAFGLPPGTVSRSSDAAGCQFRGLGGLLLTIDVTQSNQSTRMSDRSVMKSGQGRQLVISFGGRDQLRLTVPGDEAPRVWWRR
ncbi:lytic transglycosylase domain-containing protein [Actinomycetospora soli]|uniref:lytic transglycosylase domain-containing protein n=1 Tax=Actinomycetospora soli TaxID=2893887 RepID=UPI001E3F3325|nr:lytic murein transglycosylase [Actinomycetospora soli]MCD2190986.1 lytic murein transglycosylase [Actinomycetospora soli]